MIQFIVFSRKRPLQLHGYLTSLLRQCGDDIAVSVLVKIDTEYETAYAQVRDQFPRVVFKEEENFESDVQEIVDQSTAPLTSFGCDDAVFLAQIQTAAVIQLFEHVPTLLGLSMRLGKHIVIDMFGRPLEQPVFWSSPYGLWKMWDVAHPRSAGDWAYMWEVLGTLYRTDFVRDMVTSLHAGSPSQLEERGSRLWSEHTPLRYMATWDSARLVVPSPNIIQQEFPNGISGNNPLSPEFLLDCWHNGLRMDTEHYAQSAQASWRIGEFYMQRAA